MLSRPLVLTFVVGALALGGCGSSSNGSATGGSGGAAAGSGGGGGAGGSTGGAGGGSTGGAGGGSTGGAGGGSTGGAGGTSTGGAGGSAGGAGGTSTGGSGGATGGAGGTPNLGCGTTGNTCTKAETDAQNQCLITKCESAYAPCIGAGWKTGTFGGSCGTWFKCYNDCGCGNLNCQVNCGLPPAECTTCLMTANACKTSMCPEPACYGMKPDGGTTGGAGCEDLAKCCATITNESFKMACMQTVSSGNAGLCTGTLAGYKAAMVCM